MKFLSDSVGIGRYLKIKGTRKILDTLLCLYRATTPFSDSWYRPSYPSYFGTGNSRAYSLHCGDSGNSSACSSSQTKTRTASGKSKNMEVQKMINYIFSNHGFIWYALQKY